ncbi:Bax inhibitor-1/YccA family protein [Temperatibacter marinus]
MKYSATPNTEARAGYNMGLRKHMLNVYNYMASGVLLTGIVSLWLSTNPEMIYAAMSGGTGFLFMLAPLAFVMVMSFGVNRFSASALKGIFFAFAAVMGVSISTIFLTYTTESIASTFFVTAAAFGALSLYGYTTKKDLSGWGTFLFMGLIGIIIASIVNIFLGSSMMAFIINALGVLIFAGMTAYDTQRLKSEYHQLAGSGFLGKAAIMGALNLYLNFINLFLFLLSFLGNRE